MTKTGRNVESLVTDMSEVLKQLDGTPALLQEAIGELLTAVRTELAGHHDRFTGTLRTGQAQAFERREDDAARLHRIEELLAGLTRAADPGPPSAPRPAEPDASGEEPAPEAPDGEHAVPAHPEAGEPAPDPTTFTTSTEEPAMTEPTPQSGAGAPLRCPGGGTVDLIPPTMAWPAHVATLRKASAVNTLAVACHPHTWDLLAGQVPTTGGADRSPHFEDPAAADRDKRRDWDRNGVDPEKHPDIILSGRSTVTLLHALHTTVHQGLDAERGIETWSLAVTAYERIAEVVNATRPGTGTGTGDRPKVVLDDRSPGPDVR